MPTIEAFDRYQTAVLWVKTGVDRYGAPVVSEPIEVRVRWNTKRTEGTDALGNPIALDAQVVVDRVIPVDSQMWLGSLSHWYGTGSAGQDDEVMFVRTFDRVLDVKGRVARMQVGLSRFRDAPSTS
jgi:hypothetical protein